jgi:proline iminopeptidase
MPGRGVAASLTAVGAAALAYTALIRPRLARWGATDEEVGRRFPGSAIVPEGERAATMATTIDAPPERVWPWLVQLGADRAGWYRGEGLIGGRRAGTVTVHPEWQHLAVGDLLLRTTHGRADDGWRVVVLDPNRFLGLHGVSDLRGRLLDPRGPRPRVYGEVVWGFELVPLPDGRTRVVVSGHQTFRPHWLGRIVDVWLLTPMLWAMQTRMFAVLKSNVERLEREDRPPTHSIHSVE